MTVSFNQHRDRWVYNFTRGGVRYQSYCEQDGTGDPARNKTEASRIERAHIARIEQQTKQATPAPQLATHGFSLVKALREHMQVVLAEQRSVDNKQTYTAGLISFFGKDRLLDDIDEDDIERFIAWCRSRPMRQYKGGPKKGGESVEVPKVRSAQTVNHYLDMLSVVWEDAYRRHRRKIPPCPPPIDIRRLDTDEPLPNPVSIEHIGKIVDSISRKAFHLLIVVVLAVQTGMRLQEILQLTWPEVHLDARAIKLTPRTKNRKGRVILLNDTSVSILEWLLETRPDGAVYVVMYRPHGVGKPRPIKSVKRSWKTALTEAGLSGQHTFKDLRAAFGTYLANRGTDPLRLKQMMGHASIETTNKHYLVMDEDPQRLSIQLLDQHAGTLDTGNRLAKATIDMSASAEDRKAEARRFVGVYPSGTRGFEAKISITRDGRKRVLYLGSHETAEAAARAYDTEAARHGRRLNFPIDGNVNSGDLLTESCLQDLEPADEIQKLSIRA